MNINTPESFLALKNYGHVSKKSFRRHWKVIFPIPDMKLGLFANENKRFTVYVSYFEWKFYRCPFMHSYVNEEMAFAFQNNLAF